MDLFNCVYMDVGFLEKLTNDIKWESQSLYQREKQVTVDSGKKNGKGNQMKRKQYPCVSYSRDLFVYVAIKRMLPTAETSDATAILIESLLKIFKILRTYDSGSI